MPFRLAAIAIVGLAALVDAIGFERPFTLLPAMVPDSTQALLRLNWPDQVVGAELQ